MCVDVNVDRKEGVESPERVDVRVEVPDAVGKIPCIINSLGFPFSNPSLYVISAISDIGDVARNEGPPPANPSDKKPSKKQRRFILL